MWPILLSTSDRGFPAAPHLKPRSRTAGRLGSEAAGALGSIDYAALYRMGAHPYVLWHFAEAALVWAGELTWPELKEQFRSAVVADGNPDFTT